MFMVLTEQSGSVVALGLMVRWEVGSTSLVGSGILTALVWFVAWLTRLDSRIVDEDLFIFR